jgi:hypothetical protein
MPCGEWTLPREHRKPLRVPAAIVSVRTVCSARVPRSQRAAVRIRSAPSLTQLQNPYAVAVSKDGHTLFIADTHNYCIRRVDDSVAGPLSVISTVVGVCGQSSQGSVQTVPENFYPTQGANRDVSVRGPQHLGADAVLIR